MKPKMAKLAAALGIGVLALGLLVGWTFAQAEPGDPTETNRWGVSGEEMDEMHAQCQGDGEGHMMGHGHMGHGPATFEGVATLLGITTDELTAELEEGKTLLEIAQEYGVSEAELLDAILAPAKDMLQLRVQDGYLTQEQADEMYQQRVEATQTMITQSMPEHLEGSHEHGWGHEGMMGRHGSMHGDHDHDFGSMMGDSGLTFDGMMRGMGRNWMR